MLSGYFSMWLISAATTRVKGGLRGYEAGGPRGNGFGIEVLRPNSAWVAQKKGVLNQSLGWTETQWNFPEGLKIGGRNIVQRKMILNI